MAGPEAVARRLRQLRAQLGRYVEPRPRPAGVEPRADRVRLLDTNPPCLGYDELDPEIDGSVRVEVPLTDDPSFDPLPRCSACVGPCEHGLRALDEAASLAERAMSGEGLLADRLGAPPWTRWLEELRTTLPRATEARRSHRMARVGWRLDPAGTTAHPHLVRPSGAARPKAVSLRELRDEAELAPADERVALALERRRALRKDERAAFFPEIVRALVGHPRVWVGEQAGGSTWRVEALPLRLELERPDDSRIQLSPRAGPHRLSPAELGTGSLRGRNLVFYQDEARKVGVFVVDAAIAPLVEGWRDRGVEFPEEALPELTRLLSEASSELLVGASAEVQELTVEASLHVVLVAQVMPRGLAIELRACPIDGGPLLTLGMPPEEILAATPNRDLLRAKRNLDAEREVRERVLRRLDLPALDANDACFVESLAEAVGIVEMARELPEVELRFPDGPMGPVQDLDSGAISIRLGRRRDWLDLEGSVRLGDERVDLAVLVEAARRDQGFLRLKNGEVFQMEEALRKRLARIGAALSKKSRLPLLALDEAMALVGDTDGRVEDSLEAWLRERDRILAETPALPAGFRGELRPYQQEGFVWMARLAALGCGGILADDMGLGKTAQAIAMLLLRAEHGPQLVVAPTSVGFNWRRELARFAPSLEVVTYAGPKRHEALPRLRAGQVLVTSYGVVTRDVEQLRLHAWATLVLDEAQAIKNPRTARARALRALPKAWGLALTGTPVENEPSEMWSAFSTVAPGLLGTLESFKRLFAGEEGAAVGTESLRRSIRPFILRRTKAEVAKDLPPKTEVVVDVELSSRERALYDDARLAAVAELKKREVTEQTHLHVRILAALTRLRQLACHPRLAQPTSRVPSSKLERFLQLALDLRAEGRRALVFSQFVGHLALVREALDKASIPYAYLDGSTSPVERSRQVDAFQAGERPFFLISLKAGGSGLNLTAAEAVVHLDPWWNPAVEDQATDRAHRIGQTLPVTVFRLVSADTIEATMLELHREKRALFETLLDGADAPARWSAEELVQLISGPQLPL